MLKALKSQLGQSMDSVRRFLERPIELNEGNVTLGEPASSLRQQARDEQRQKVRRMRRDLYTLMQQHPDSRELMRHLDVVERTLRRQGLVGVEKLPVRVVAKALAQLEDLVWDWSPVGLAEFRSRMAVIVKTRPAESLEDEAREGTSTESLEIDLDLATHRAVELTDVTDVETDLSAFAEMERSWAGQMPEGVAKAVEAAKAPPTET